MANVAALKKKAADFEQKKQLDKAIAAYREVLDAYDAGDDDNIDVGLYNRVGDMLVRQGNVPDGVLLYERAVDLYSEGGFFNNAIALCNKILRTSPGRVSVYYKLGKISAAKGFKADAKANFLEYADRMQKSDKMEEAFRALKEFADLVPDQDDIRLMLAEHLTKAGKKEQAVEQLQLLHARYAADGRTAEAEATAERMKGIDPKAVPRGTEHLTEAKGDDLIFIDLDAPLPRHARTTRAAEAPAPVAPPIVESPTTPSAWPAAAPDVVAPALPASIEVETTALAMDAAQDDASATLLGLEPTSLAEPPAIETAPLAPREFGEIDFGAIKEEPTSPRSSAGLALLGELPVLDVTHVTPPTGLPLVDAPTPAVDAIDFLELAAPSATTPTNPGAVGSPPSAPMEFLDAPTIPADATAFKIVEAEELEDPPRVRRTTSLLASDVGMLARLADEPENWGLRRRYAEALLDDGDRDGGLRELEAALTGFERDGNLDAAREIADEIVRVNPASVKHHQKRVEFALRVSDKAALVEAYVALGDALLREGQAEKSRVVYQRVLDIAPDDVRAVGALEAFGADRAAPSVVDEGSSLRRPTRRYTAQAEAPSAPEAVPAPAPVSDDDQYISLGDWLREDEAPKNTRMVVDEEEPSGDEQADFDDMLKKFKQGVAENVEDEDYESHYDLGVAYKEMGLLDEAIAEFQKALRATTNRVRTLEALGQCFLEKKQLAVAVTILQRAIHEPGVSDERLVGVLYLLGYIHESLGKHAEAKTFYERVFAVDIQFRDVGDRLNAVEKTAS